MGDRSERRLARSGPVDQTMRAHLSPTHACLLAIAALGLAACGSSQTTDTSSPPAPVAVTVTTAAPAAVAPTRTVTSISVSTTAVDPSACGQPGVTCNPQGMNVDSPQFRELCDQLYTAWKDSGMTDRASIQRYGQLNCDQ